MKKIIIAATLLMSVFTFAQQREKGDVELAPVLGVSFSNYYSGNATTGNESITRATFGVQGDYYFNDRWSLRSALMYQQMGTQVNVYGEVSEDNLRYMTIPVNANWHFGSTRKWHLNFGPSFSFLTSAESTVDGRTIDIKKYVKSFQLGLSLGIGYKIEVSEKLGIGISYNENLGLTEVSNIKGVSFRNTHGGFNLSAVFKLD